jgi:hypothetical protein
MRNQPAPESLPKRKRKQVNYCEVGEDDVCVEEKIAWNKPTPLKKRNKLHFTKSLKFVEVSSRSALLKNSMSTPSSK